MRDFEIEKRFLFLPRLGGMISLSALPAPDVEEISDESSNSRQSQHAYALGAWLGCGVQSHSAAASSRVTSVAAEYI